MAKIFISYRRDDTGILCERLTDRLTARFGARSVFRDISAITVGSAWEQVLQTALQDCYVVIALIGPGWLSARDAQGRPRLFDPQDFVRRELATALAQRKRIVPVLADGARMPQPHELPPDLAPLTQIPPLILRPDPSFEADVQALIQVAEPGVRRRVPHPAVALCGLIGLLGVIALLAAVILPDNLLDPLLFNLYLLGVVAMLLGGALIVARSIAVRAWLWPAAAALVIVLLLVSATGVYAEFTLGDTAHEQVFVALAVFTQPLALGLALAFGFFGPHVLTARRSSQQWLRSYRWVVGGCASLAGVLMTAVMGIDALGLSALAALYLAGTLAAAAIGLAGAALALASGFSRHRWTPVVLLTLLGLGVVVGFQLFGDPSVPLLAAVIVLFASLGGVICALDYFALRGDLAELRKRVTGA